MGNAVKELKEKTPLPMNTMLDKETRESALDARQKRKEMVVKNVPPTTPCKYTKLPRDLFMNNYCKKWHCINQAWWK